MDHDSARSTTVRQAGTFSAGRPMENPWCSERGVQTQVLAVPIDGGPAKQLPEVSSGAHMAYKVFEFSDPGVRIDYPVWSPDGRSVLFDRAEPRTGDLWMLEHAR
jgi:hypothetical protein